MAAELKSEEEGIAGHLETFGKRMQVLDTLLKHLDRRSSELEALTPNAMPERPGGPCARWSRTGSDADTSFPISEWAIRMGTTRLSGIPGANCGR